MASPKGMQTQHLWCARTWLPRRGCKHNTFGAHVLGFPEGFTEGEQTQHLRCARTWLPHKSKICFPSPSGNGCTYVRTEGVARTCTRRGRKHNTYKSSPHLLPHKSKICEKGTCCAYAHPFGERLRTNRRFVTPSVPRARPICNTFGVVFAHLLPHKSSICEKGTCCAHLRCHAHPFGERLVRKDEICKKGTYVRPHV